MSKKKKHHPPHEEEGGEAWLLPYSDLMTLLLAVFIVLFAVSQVDVQKAQAMSEAFTEGMMSESVQAGRQAEAQQREAEGTPETPMTELENMEKIKEELDKKLESEHLTASIKTNIDKRGLVISFSNAIIFDPGSAVIKPENEQIILEVADMITVMNNYIRVEGHTDNVPMNSDLYPSNWDLSTARAVNVVRLFTAKANASPEKLIAVGYGEYRPIADNSTEEGKQKNRRIDIIILSDKYNDLEEHK